MLATRAWFLSEFQFLRAVWVELRSDQCEDPRSMALVVLEVTGWLS
jgi:hypothetical protein